MGATNMGNDRMGKLAIVDIYCCNNDSLSTSALSIAATILLGPHNSKP